jgi:hypothetical protein
MINIRIEEMSKQFSAIFKNYSKDFETKFFVLFFFKTELRKEIENINNNNNNIVKKITKLEKIKSNYN